MITQRLDLSVLVILYVLHIRMLWRWWWWIVFVVWLTNEKRLALYPAGTIVRYFHNRESSTRRKQDLSVRRTLGQALLDEDVQ